jgi:uncharacterized protein YycO
MKRILAPVLLLLSVISTAHAYTPKDGDIVFQTSRSSQSLAIQTATSSPYSHVGVVLFLKGKPFVLEAVQPVRYTPLNAWLDHGEKGHYVVKRMKQPLTQTAIARLRQHAKDYLGKPYDLTFEWSDDRIYCSELVWKLYKQAANIELAPLSKLGSFKLDSPVVQQKLKARYGDHIPLDEPVISPAAIFDSPQLETVAAKGRL